MEDLSGFDRGQDDAPPTGSHARVANRESMFLNALAQRPGVADSPLRVRNLSVGGMMAESEHVFTVGETLTVELRGVGAVSARIAWVNGARIGVAFDHPINPQLARKAPPKSPGSQMMVLPPVRLGKRPGLR